ncbi:hypothetical protein GN958_ATG20129 [Phytophthora infestans]|uniref:Uncharacterized protein n=1 Tax=Phytophthora infestans TaxID=4787 RepID=A0A8S9TP43_PHYIN|nr:hypothetical protein GN958_ATG20129 [Phytophthora infestans]
MLALESSRHTKSFLEVVEASSHSPIGQQVTPFNTMFANHFATIAPHAAVMVVSPKDKSSSPTTPASKDRKKNRAKSERDPAADKKPVRISTRQTC